MNMRLGATTAFRRPVGFASRSLARQIHSSSILLRQVVYDYAQVKDLTSGSTSKKRLIDVREPPEFEAGNIPNSTNLPLSSLESILTLSESEFESKIGMPKPDKSEELVFYCKSGVRSTDASGIAEKLGYKTVGNYKGSWNDWQTKSQTRSSSSSSSSRKGSSIMSPAGSAAESGIKNPNLESGKGEGAQGGIDLKAMNQKEEKRAEGTKKKEGNQGPLASHKDGENESVRSGAELSDNKKFE